MPATTQTQEGGVTVSHGIVCKWTSVGGKLVCSWQLDSTTEPEAAAAETAAA